MSCSSNTRFFELKFEKAKNHENICSYYKKFNNFKFYRIDLWYEYKQVLRGHIECTCFEEYWNMTKVLDRWT